MSVSQGSMSDALSYAQAVFAKAVEDWQRDLQAINQKLLVSPDLVKKLDEGRGSFQKRQKELDAILPADLSEQTRNFVYTLLKEGDLNLLGKIITSLSQLASKGPNVEVAVVTTAIALDEAEQEQFRTKLIGQHGDQLEFEFLVDPSILGGVIVQVGDKIIDGSMVSKLNSVRENLIRA